MATIAHIYAGCPLLPWTGRQPNRLDKRAFSIGLGLTCTGASLVAESVKNLPAMQVTQVGFLGQEDPLEKEMAAHSSILAWRTPGTEEPGGLQSMGSQKVRHGPVSETYLVIRS